MLKKTFIYISSVYQFLYCLLLLSDLNPTQFIFIWTPFVIILLSWCHLKMWIHNCYLNRRKEYFIYLFYLSPWFVHFHFMSWFKSVSFGNDKVFLNKVNKFLGVYSWSPMIMIIIHNLLKLHKLLINWRSLLEAFYCVVMHTLQFYDHLKIFMITKVLKQDSILNLVWSSKWNYIFLVKI